MIYGNILMDNIDPGLLQGIIKVKEKDGEKIPFGYLGTQPNELFGIKFGTHAFLNNELKSVMGVVSISGVPRILIKTEIGKLFNGNSYTITGTVVPVNSVVYLSTSTFFNYESLDRTVIKAAIPDSGGSWEMYIDNWPGEDYGTLWILTDPIGVIAINASINFSYTGQDSGSSGGGSGGSSGGMRECGTCGGDGLMDCYVCYGTGILGDYFTCGVCSGEGIIIQRPEGTCETCSGDGYVDYIQEEPCGRCGTNGYIQEPHQCENCYGTGKVDEEDCQYCWGTGEIIEEIECPECHGEGNIIFGETTEPCPDCGGSGNVVVYEWEETCNDCGGSGEVLEGEICYNCGGSGEEACDSCGGSGSVPECLSGDTMIALFNGEEKRIDELSGEEILIDEYGKPTSILKIERNVWSNSHTIYYFENNITIDEVFKHRFFNADQGFYQYLKNWEIGERAVTKEGDLVRLIKKEVIQEKKERFGLWTESGSYYANNLLSGGTIANYKSIQNISMKQMVNMLNSIDKGTLLKLVGKERFLP